MLEKIKEFKEYLEALKDKDPLIDKAIISKLLVVANLAEMSIYGNTKLDESVKPYFDRQAAVGRYFMDSDEEKVARMYLEICEYMKKNYW